MPDVNIITAEGNGHGPLSAIRPKGGKLETLARDASRRHGMGGFFAARDASDVYSAVEHITGPVAGPLLEHAGLLTDGELSADITRPVSVLDMACGTGVVTATLHDAMERSGGRQQQQSGDLIKITCSDISEPQVSWVRRRIKQMGWRNTEAVVTDAIVRTYSLDSPLRASEEPPSKS